MAKNVGILAMDIYFPPSYVQQVIFFFFCYWFLKWFDFQFVCWENEGNARKVLFIRISSLSVTYRFIFLLLIISNCIDLKICWFYLSSWNRKHWRLMMALAKGNIPLDLDRIAWHFVLRWRMSSQWGWWFYICFLFVWLWLVRKLLTLGFICSGEFQFDCCYFTSREV